MSGMHYFNGCSKSVSHKFSLNLRNTAMCGQLATLPLAYVNRACDLMLCGQCKWYPKL